MYSIGDIKSIVQARWVQMVNEDAPVHHFIYDARQSFHGKTGLFIAFKGQNHDGHDFINQAYSKGVTNFLVQCSDRPFPEDANVLLVPDTLEALQSLARYHRSQFTDIPVIGITGSTGKTTVKEWLYEMLTPERHVVKSPRSFNSSLGVPLSVLRLEEHHEVAIFEAGPGGPGQMNALSDIIQCNIGIFTNIGDAHSAQYPSQENKIREKILLFKSASTLIYCLDHSDIDREIKAAFKGRSFTWSFNQEADVRVSDSRYDKFGHTHLDIVHQGETVTLVLPSRDRASLENAMHVITTLIHLGFPVDTMQEKLMSLPQIQMRLELKAGIHQCLILNDSYSADWDSFQLALNFLRQQETKGKRTIIISDFVASENKQGTLYRKLADAINASGVHRVLAVGSEIKALKGKLKSDITCQYYADTDALLSAMDTGLRFKKESVLVKGARNFHLERVADRLIERTHHTVLEIDMYALSKNLKVYTGLLESNTKIMVMVKANAYGAGSVEISRMLEYHGVDYLAVAYADEAIHLRNHGIRTPIMILNPEVPQFSNYLRFDLEPEISSLRLMDKWIHFCLSVDRWPGFHIKLETGMHRLGYEEKDMPKLLKSLQDFPRLNVRSIFSHLAASGEEEHDVYTQQQFQAFEKNYNRIVEVLGYRPLRHILNSAGIIRFPANQYEMVRLGAGLYGIDSYLPFREYMHTVLSLKSRITQIKNIHQGQSVGYSRRFIAQRDMRIAVISIGYGDGVPRAVSDGKYAFLIQGQLAPILGAVAMDMCMVDITHIPSAKEEDEVEIFGKNLAVQSLAEAAGTISYEIFTSISSRVKRVYFY